jgi:diguanylate cyclase (GGDEF)-like protein
MLDVPSQPADLERAVGEEASTLGVLYIDADHFKAVNDTSGRQTGDRVMRMAGQSGCRR